MHTQATYTEHPVTDYRSLLGEGSQLIDVREPEEVAAGTLPGAVNIPLGELPYRTNELRHDRRIVLLCRSGARSGQAAGFLASRGFGDVVNLTGGMLAHDSQT